MRSANVVRGGGVVLAVFVVALAAGTSSADGKRHKHGHDDEVAGPLQESDTRMLLDMHNAVRAGVSKPAGYDGAWTAVPPLAWSDEVAAAAQQWADHLRDDNKCKMEHSDDHTYGENLAAGVAMAIPQAVQMWASEGQRYHYSPVYEFEIPTGHYTQVVWRKTTQLGCGRAACGHNVVVVCRYSPPGNYIGGKPY
jgi:pathogenesis-related protein 1